MSIVNTDTGELVEPLSRTDAERLTTRIRLRLDTIADNYTAVMPLIREAIDRQAYAALGYTGVSQYVSECFGDALSQLGVEVRREVVRELTEAGMSTRAIAPVVGVSNYTIQKDRESGVRSLTPEPETPEPEEAPATASATPASGSGQIPEGGEAPESQRSVPSTSTPRPPVTGIDGKTYTPPAPRASRRKPLPDFARDAGWELRKAVERLERVGDDDRFGANKEQVASHLRGHLTNAVEVCQDLLARINEQEESTR